MPDNLREAVYRRVWHSISPDLAAQAGMSFDDLRLFISNRVISDTDLANLARVLGMRGAA
jgi:hypothetical protein